MRIRVLGCSGGIGGQHLATTALLLDHDVLIDGGTGVCDLGLPELAAIDHIFVTHSHLDHIACIPFLVDTVGEMRREPITLYATAPTLAALRRHIFNWEIWPDFGEIPSAQAPYLRFQEIAVGVTVDLGGRRLTPIPANHTVPAVGYLVDSGAASLVFSGDTGPNDALWEVVNGAPNLRFLIIETAFANRERALAEASKHLCPSMLSAELAKMRATPQVFITHLKPGQIEATMREIEREADAYRPRMLTNGYVFEL